MIAEAIICMALNVYHEARNQSLVGQIAVAQVTVNRVSDSRYPDTVCGVVKQSITYSSGDPVKNKCQFSWYCDGKSDKPKDEDSYYTALHIARKMLEGNLIDFTEGATHYHATYLRPDWAETKTYITQIDDHIFYRWEK